MRYLLDTDICINLIRKRPPHLLQRFTNYATTDIAVSSITIAELRYGVYRSSKQLQNQQALEQFLIPLVLLDFDYDASVAYGRLRAYLEAQGTPIGALGILIAAHALSRQLTVITNNTREFARVPELVVENWATP